MGVVMELKFSVLFGIILGIIVMAVATAAWMVGPAYVDAAAIVTIIVATLVLTKLYVGKVKTSMGGMIAVGVVWIIVTAILDVAYVTAFGLDFVAYYMNPMIYAGYIVLIVCAAIGHRIFSGKKPSPSEKPAK
jgi:hypothetical protein